jgi:hypothetical protein
MSRTFPFCDPDDNDSIMQPPVAYESYREREFKRLEMVQLVDRLSALWHIDKRTNCDSAE